MLINLRKPKCVVLKEVLSDSGKYKLYYGHHFVKGKMCYDVGAINQETGEILARHYLDTGKGTPKSEALRIYNEYEKVLTRRAQHQERDDNDARIADRFRRALYQRNVGDA
jgi:hypothetical protein